MAGDRNVIELLMHDHRAVEELFANFRATTDPGERKRIADRVIIELVRHSVAEEEYLYPATKSSLPGGDELAEREIAEHSEAEKTMNELDRMSGDNVEFDMTMRRLMELVTAHVAEEEGELFPKLKSALSSDELLTLGQKIEKAKRTAPTRPHPMSPSHPPMNKAVAPGTGLVDRLRDAVTGRGEG